MILIFCVILGLALLSYGVQRGRNFLLDQEASQLNLEVTALKIEREKKLKKAAEESGGLLAGAQAVLLQIFEEATPWSALLKEVTARAPRALWLTNFKSYVKEQEDVSGITINGRADDASVVAHFIKALSKSSYFQNVTLTSSQQVDSEKGAFYQFVIDLILTAQPKKVAS